MDTAERQHTFSSLKLRLGMMRTLSIVFFFRKDEKNTGTQKSKY